MNGEREIGIFDSGVGGLSILREVRRLLPAEHLLYFGDDACVPYGPRPVAWIRERSALIAGFLEAQGAKAIVVACNTASSAALRHLRERFALPIVGIVPAVKPAARATRSGRVGVLATATTVKGDSFADLVHRFATGVEVETVVGEGLVPLVEEGDVTSPRARQLVRAYVAPLVEHGADVIVLGCTHYPFLRELIAQEAGTDVTVLDPAEAVARQTVRVLSERGLLRSGTEPGSEVFYTSGEPAVFARVASQLLGRPVTARPAPEWRGPDCGAAGAGSEGNGA
ncbi:MAG: glutamate racemase [Chloroflexota bacterium]